MPENLETIPSAEPDSSPVETDVSEVESPAESLSIDEKWDALDISGAIKAQAEDDVPSGELQPPTPIPSAAEEKVESQAETEAETSETVPETEESAETETQLDEKSAIANLSRKELRQFEQKVITPLRDLSAPIEDVYLALREFHPTRANELALKIADSSAAAYPDEWLARITGIEGITKEQITLKFNGEGGKVSDPSQTSEQPPLTGAPEVAAAIAYLNEYYGEDWKDAANDDQLIESDKAAAQALRYALSQDTQKEQEISKLKAELDDIKPQIAEIKTTQETEYRQAVDQTFEAMAHEYRETVESAALPRVFADAGIEVLPDDIAEVKGTKELIRSRFETPDGTRSEFDYYLENAFSQREQMAKAITRVGENFRAAAELGTKAKFTADKAKAAEMKAQADSLRRQAKREQDTLTVFTQKAAKEFLESPQIKPALQLLEINADLQRKITLISGRTEIVGQGAVSMGATWQDEISQMAKEGKDPFDFSIGERLAAQSR